MNEFDIFVEAAEKEPVDVEAYLSEVCTGHPRLKDRVRALLVAHRGPGFLDALAASDAEWNTPEIEGYKLLEQIGEGAFGSVYMAEQVAPVRRRVAMKVVKLGMDTKQVVARFDAERQAMAMMDHQCIARVYDAGVTNSGRPYFAMELVRGESITVFCDNERLVTRKRLELVVAVCRAIQHAHQKGIIHRDIKPSNVMVTYLDGKALPKVIDFGIAKATEEPLTKMTLFTQFRQMVGTPAYMSPEQAELNASDVDTRSDIYSMGVLLYELLTGKVPLEFKASNYDEILREVRDTDPPKLSARVSSLSNAESTTIAEKRGVAPTELIRTVEGELNWIVAKALSKDRSRRYDTAAALADDIERYLNNRPVLASPPSAIYKLVKFMRRNRLLVGSTAVVFFALVAGLAMAILGQKTAQEQMVVAEFERKKALDQANVARSERENAVAQAVRARKTFEMLRDLLVVAHAGEGHGPDYTVREALDEFAATLPARLDGSMPDVEAEINSIIGNTYDSLTFHYDAAKFLLRSAELRESEKPVDHGNLATAYADLARNAQKRCHLTEAEKAANLALDSYKKSNANAPEDIVEILSHSKEIRRTEARIIQYSEEFRHDEILTEVNHVVSEFTESLPGTLMMRAIFFLLDLGEYEKAIAICKLSPSELNARYSDQERGVRAILNNALTIVYRQHGLPELAEELAASVRFDADGDASWFHNNPWQKMIVARAILMDKQNSSNEDRERALKLSDEFLARMNNAPVKVSPYLMAMACQAHAEALLQTGDSAAAENVLRSGLIKVSKSSPFSLGLIERQLAELLESSGKLEAAETVLRNARDWRADKLPNHYVQKSVAETNLALFLNRVREDSAAEARKLLELAAQRVSNRPAGDYFKQAVNNALQKLGQQ